MQITLHLTSLVILFGVATGLTLSLLLWMAPWGNRRANRCLSLLLAVSCAFSAAYIPHIESGALPPEYQLIFSLQLLPGPLLYFFTRIQTQPAFHWRWRHAWHLLPAALSALVWQLQLPLSAEGPLNLPCPAAMDCELVYRARFVHRLAAYLSLSGYSIAALLVLRPHLRRVKENYSAIKEVSLSWLKALICVYLLATAAGIAIELLGYPARARGVTPGLLQALAPLLLSLLLGWFGLRQRRIQLGDREAEHAQPPATLETTERKYQTSSLTDAGAAAIWQRLQQVMAEDKPHLEPGLKIAELAHALGVPVHHLSETINGFAQLSFYDFINRHRVQEAAQLLTDPRHSQLSVTDIGLQAGFNSNSTFFSHFKKHLKQTPRQYRQQRTNNTTP